MKRDLLIAAGITLLICAISYGAALTGTNIAAPVVPFTDADSYPSHDAQYGKGGFMQFAYSSARRLIPAGRMTRGMFVYAHDSKTVYQLYSTPGYNWRTWLAPTSPPVTYLPASITVVTGTLFSGNVASLTAIDANQARINEVSGTPGFNAEILFTGVTGFNKLHAHERYEGSASHTVQVALYNWGTTAWDVLGTIGDQNTLTALSYDIVNPAAYISGGQVKARFYHSSTGVGTHYLLLDYLVLKQDAGSGITEHGALTGLADDDHTQYALADGSRGGFPTLPQFVNFSSNTQTKFNNMPAGPTGSRGYDGFDGDNYTCAIGDGPLAVVYDTVGLIPKYSSEPFSALYYKNGAAMNYGSQWKATWTTYDSANSHITGATPGYSGRLFTPTILAAYSSNKKFNQVFLNISAVQKCRAAYGVPVTKIGAKGDKGDPGDLSALTRANVTNVLDDASDTMLSLQPATSSGTVAMIGIRDYAGNVRGYIDSSGYQYFKDANGYVLAKIQTDGTLLLLDKPGYQRAKLDNFGRLEMKDYANKRRIFTNASTAIIQTYRSNGTTIGFQIYSSGRWVGAEGQPGSNGQCLAADTNGRRYWTTCGSGGAGTPGGNNMAVQYNRAGAFAGDSFFRYSTNAARTSGTLIIQ